MIRMSFPVIPSSFFSLVPPFRLAYFLRLCYVRACGHVRTWEVAGVARQGKQIWLVDVFCLFV